MEGRKFCPVSGKMCTDCKLYIGRHFYTCISKDKRSQEIVARKNEKRRQSEKAREDGRYGTSSFDENTPSKVTWFHNVEDTYWNPDYNPNDPDDKDYDYDINYEYFYRDVKI